MFKQSIFIGCLLGLFLASNTTFAVMNVYQSFVAEETVVASFSGDEGDQWGEELAKGDFNGDGITDLAFSSPLASSGELQWNGEVKILLGSKDRSEQTVLIKGENSGDQLGRALATGDFDGDGVDDLAIGAHNAYEKGKRLGKVYIFMGGDRLDNQVAKMIVVGQKENEAFRLEIAAEDLDLNGKSDLIIGAPLAGFEGKNQTGAAYVFLNFDNGFGVPRVIQGHQEKERFGSSIVSRQMFGDVYPDIAIAGYKAANRVSSQAGAVYLYAGTRIYGLDGMRPSLTLAGELSGQWFGFAMASEDVNDDGFGDLAVSSFPYWSKDEQSGVEIFLGGEEGVIKEPEMKIIGNEGERMVAADLVMADFNRDQKMELVMGGPGIDNVAKSDYAGGVYFAEVSSGVKDIEDYQYKAAVYGAQGDDWFGNSVLVGDFDGDLNNDLVVGAIYYDGIKADSGKVYLMYGNGDYFGVKEEFSDPVNEVSRGELVREVVDGFELREKRKEEIEECMEFREFCLFNFSSLSSFEGMETGPQLVLYPDVRPGSKYYEEVNLATILGIINGYMRDKDSPFRPDGPVTRIQALKVILGATDAVKFKYQFELISELGSYEEMKKQISGFADVDASVPHMWWYPRYTLFALKNGLIDKSLRFRPDEYISQEELEDLIQRTKVFINGGDEKDK